MLTTTPHVAKTAHSASDILGKYEARPSICPSVCLSVCVSASECVLRLVHSIQTELNSSVNSHVLRTNRKLTDLVSLQPINTK